MQHYLLKVYSKFTSSPRWILFWNLPVQFFFLYLKIEYTTLRKRRDSLWYHQFSKKKLITESVDVLEFHGFIQAILMSGRWYKKLSLSIEFWDSIFIFLKHTGFELAVNINHLKVSSILSYLFVLRCKKAKTFQELYPLN